VTRKIFHIMLGTDGGTERFFLRLTKAFAERGIEQQFAIRPGRDWRGDLEPLGEIHEGHFLRRTPIGLWQAVRLRRHMVNWGADAIMAWRAPAARLIPKGGHAAKIVRLGDYPWHLRHFGEIGSIVGNSPAVLAHCRDLGWQGREALVSNFPAAVPATPVPRSTLSTPEDVPLVCAVGRFHRSKGFDTLIEALARTEDLWLWLVGDGELRPDLEALAERLGVSDRIRMPGWVPNSADYIASADIFCIPSRKEPLGNTLLEGWQTARPVVATRSEGPDWAATHGQDALMVEVDDVTGLAAALEELAGSPELADRLVRGGKEALAKRFSKRAVVDAYLALFEDLR
jgi:glycosyltransferase involved in cell wall biosynthesis